MYFEKYKLIKPWYDGGSLLDIFLIIGAFISASLAGEFSIRVPRRKTYLLQGFIGGFLMGFSARLAMGCNIGGFFSSIPLLALGGWYFGTGLVLGGIAGAKYVQWSVEKELRSISEGVNMK